MAIFLLLPFHFIIYNQNNTDYRKYTYYINQFKNSNMKSIVFFTVFLMELGLAKYSASSVEVQAEKEMKLIERFSEFVKRCKQDLMIVEKPTVLSCLRAEILTWLMVHHDLVSACRFSSSCSETTLLSIEEYLMLHQLRTITESFFFDIYDGQSIQQIKQLQPTTDVNGRKYVYGMAGIARIFGASLMTAHRIKKSGIIDAAITQIGRKIVVDAELALKLASRKNVNTNN